MRTISRRYTLEREIGRGAAGSVWVAFDTQLQRRVAVKVLRRDCLERSGVRTRFEREALTIAQVRSPYVVHVYDAGVDEGEPFIVMEWLEGESLEDLLQRSPRLPASMVADVVSHLARGLSLTHAAGIVHRDVKPANIFLSKDDHGFVPKLLDFGVATLKTGLASDGASGQSVAGTPQFMSPEQVCGLEVDARSDLWALGVVAYRMLTGRLPFEADDFSLLRKRICEEAHVPPSRHNEKLSSSVDDFFVHALAKDPRKRHRSAIDLAAGLLRASERQAPTAIRILLLDDEPDMELLLRHRFRRELQDGMYELLFATDGQAGLEILRGRKDIDLVLTDLNMPGMDGLTFLAHVGKVNPVVRVVVVSAYNDMGNLRLAMNRGAFDFVVKPIDFDDLQLTIEKCASHVSVLRQAIRSKQENGLLRLLVSSPELDALRDVHVKDHEDHIDASVAFVSVDAAADANLEDARPLAVVRLADRLANVLPNLLTGRPDVLRLVGSSIMAVYAGEAHAHRALDSCLAIHQKQTEHGPPELAPPLPISIGLESGVVAISKLDPHAANGGFGAVVLGSVVSQAFLLQNIAAPGEVIVGPSIAESIPSSIYRELISRDTFPDLRAPMFRLNVKTGPTAAGTTDPLQVKGQASISRLV